MGVYTEYFQGQYLSGWFDERAYRTTQKNENQQNSFNATTLDSCTQRLRLFSTTCNMDSLKHVQVKLVRPCAGIEKQGSYLDENERKLTEVNA